MWKLVSRDTAVRRATGYELDGRGARFFSCPRHSDRIWSPSSLLLNEYRALYPRGKADDA
jgi:hypothetical protein